MAISHKISSKLISDDDQLSMIHIGINRLSILYDALSIRYITDIKTLVIGELQCD